MFMHVMHSMTLANGASEYMRCSYVVFLQFMFSTTIARLGYQGYKTKLHASWGRFREWILQDSPQGVSLCLTVLGGISYGNNVQGKPPVKCVNLLTLICSILYGGNSGQSGVYVPASATMLCSVSPALDRASPFSVVPVLSNVAIQSAWCHRDNAKFEWSQQQMARCIVHMYSWTQGTVILS